MAELERFKKRMASNLRRLQIKALLWSFVINGLLAVPLGIWFYRENPTPVFLDEEQFLIGYGFAYAFVGFFMIPLLFFLQTYLIHAGQKHVPEPETSLTNF